MSTALYARFKQIRRSSLYRLAIFMFLIATLIYFVLASMSANQVDALAIDRSWVLKTTAERITNWGVVKWSGIHYESGLDYNQRSTTVLTTIIYDIRWPRVVMAILVGAALGVSGAVLQGIFRNPLADPGLIGVSSGAAIAAVIAILLHANLQPLLDFVQKSAISPQWLVHWAEDVSGRRLAESLAAAAGGWLMTLIVYQLSRVAGRTSTANLLLVGLAINAIGNAVVGVATFIGNERRTSDITFWSLGSLKNLTWADVYITAPIVILGIIILPFYSRQLNIMTLGESEARNLGVNTARLLQITVGISALLIGISVGFAGIITFIGLVVPHIARLLLGPDHRYVLPSSMLGGAIFLVAADMYGRTLPPPTDTGIAIEVPVGVLTAIVGGPFFLMLVLISQRQRGQ